jgi:hypothetical protein
MTQVSNQSLLFKVVPSTIDLSKEIKMENYYAQGNNTSVQLTRKLIYLIGSKRDDFPMATKLFGGSYFDMSNISKENDDTHNMYLKSTTKVLEKDEFSYPVMGEHIKGGTVAQNVTGSLIGIGCSEFEVAFDTNYLTKGFVVQSPNGIQLYVVDVRVAGDNYYYYKMKLANGNTNRICPEAELLAGTVWINMFAPVAQSGSRNINVGKAILPGSNKNQLTKMRCGMTWESDTSDAMTAVYVIQDGKSREVNLQANDESTKTRWIDQYTYNYEIECLRMIESCLWYGQYNRNYDGTVGLSDNFTGKVISIGSGLLEQIGNKISYSNFSYSLFNSVIMKSLYGIKGMSKELTLYTGTLGFRLWDAAMKREGYSMFGISGFTGVADKFVSGTNSSLMLGGYFDGFYSIDGWIIKVKKVSTFDTLVANSPLDRVSQLPLNSARMVIIDDGDCEGESNLQLLIGKNYNPYKDGIKEGMNNIPPSIQTLSKKNQLEKSSSGVKSVTTDLEESTYMRIMKCGIQLLRGNTSFDFRYKP